MTTPASREPVQAESPGGGPPTLDPETLAAATLGLRRDLWVFRTAYLPVLLRSPSPDLVQRWQWTVQTRADALSHEGDSRVATLVEERVLQLFRTGHP
jgi:hypothetical protein